MQNTTCWYLAHISADAFFARGQHLKFDAVLAMYHDQGLIPFKSLALAEGINYTAGLPIIRTSPDHGTAFDIAGKNKADTDSFLAAIYGCIDIINQRARNTQKKTERTPEKNGIGGFSQCWLMKRLKRTRDSFLLKHAVRQTFVDDVRGIVDFHPAFCIVDDVIPFRLTAIVIIERNAFRQAYSLLVLR